jgi:outer membrane immunogenic protein
MAARRLVSIIACAVALIAGASAQRAEAQNWDGAGLVRFGVFLQGSFIDYDIAQTSAAGVVSNFSASPNGGGVGLSAGYDLRLGSFVVGVEADASFDDGGARSRPATQEQYGIDFFSTLRGRFGYVIDPAFMIYGTAGFSMLGSEYKQNSLPGAGGIGGTGNKKFGTMGGFVFGAGIEYDFGWGTGFLEYLHADMSGWDFNNFAGTKVAIDGTQDVVRLGMKFKVGHDYSHDVYKRPGGLR